MWLIDLQSSIWLIDCWIDWMVNPTWFPFQVNRILSILVSLLLLSSSPLFFYAVIYSYSIRQNQYLFQYQWLYCTIYLLNNGFTNVNNDQQILIHSNHSIASLSNPIFLIIRSNQFAINIEQILIQTILWLWLVDWNHCHL